MKVFTGFHSLRVWNIAILDVIATIIGAVMMAYVLDTSVVYTMMFLFSCGVLFHRLFSVRTTVDKMMFSNAMST